MPKSLFVDPSVVRAPGKVTFNEIPVNQYNKTIEQEKARYDRVNRELVKTEKRTALTMSATNPLINLFLNTGLVAVIVVGAARVNDALSEPGRIIAFFQYFTLLSNAMLSITRIFVMTSKGEASAKRVSQVLELVEKEGITCAVLKSRSPTCGVKQVYDGTFSGKLVDGMGLFAQALRDAGYRVVDSEDL